MSYYCDKCERKHIRGWVFKNHKVYDKENAIDITSEVEESPWIETCYDCQNNEGNWSNGSSSKPTCKFLNLSKRKEDRKRTIYLDSGIGGGIPKSCFRVPRTSKIYRKCQYYEEEKNNIELLNEVKNMEIKEKVQEYKETYSVLFNLNLDLEIAKDSLKDIRENKTDNETMKDWLVNIELDIKEFMNKISERKAVLIEK